MVHSFKILGGMAPKPILVLSISRTKRVGENSVLVSGFSHNVSFIFPNTSRCSLETLSLSVGFLLGL